MSHIKPALETILNSCFFLSTDECQVNDDCPLDKACISQECQDPCRGTSCGTRAECKVEYHYPICFCPRGLQGNPLVACIEVGCLHDDECHHTERCDKVRGECVPLCLGQPCAVGASCTAQNHREVCNCDPPLQGDGHVYCTQSE